MLAMVIADDQDEKEILSLLLRREGHAVAASSDHQRVLKSWTEHPADIIVVSLQESTPEPSQIIEAVRVVTQVPMLFIIEKPPESLICTLLREGADAVLIRPVSPNIFGAHIKALMRRATNIPSYVLPSLELETIALDPSTRMVTVSGKEPKRLTQLEFRLLYTLLTNRGQVLPLDILVERIWGYSGDGNQDLIRGLVSRLRRKIESDPDSQHYIETIPGVGYRFMAGEL
ncbi:MAG: hypothetical protein GTO18_16865 [Anaerolineales bacterium]|nr:hypothetical protein [Anaerolineales bacterium]